MIARSILENRVFLELIYKDSNKELWKYYIVNSLFKITKKAKGDRNKELKEHLTYLYEIYNIDPKFYKTHTNYEHIMSMISFLYFRLDETIKIYCSELRDRKYTLIEDELYNCFDMM